MLRIYTNEQLITHLTQEVKATYLLYGADPLILQESQQQIIQQLKKQGQVERHSVNIDSNTDWDTIRSLCQARSLFAEQQLFLFYFPEHGLNSLQYEHFSHFLSYRHQDVFLIICLTKFTREQEQSQWARKLVPYVTISCQTPEREKLPQWLIQRANRYRLSLDEASAQLLCYHYEGNLLALSQLLEQLILIYPDGKLTLPRIEHLINDVAHFSPYHWINALWSAQTKRALHILHQLHLEEIEPLILVRVLQRELIQLIQLKQEMGNQSLQQLFDRAKIWQQRRPLLSQVLNTLSMPHFSLAIHLLKQIEQGLKQDPLSNIWQDFENITLLLCNALPPTALLTCYDD